MRIEIEQFAAGDDSMSALGVINLVFMVFLFLVLGGGNYFGEGLLGLCLEVIHKILKLFDKEEDGSL